MSVHSKIKEFRESKGLTQTELGNMIGKSLRMIQKYETEDDKNSSVKPSLEVLNKIAVALDVTVNELLGIGPISSTTDYRIIKDMARSVSSNTDPLKLEYDDSYLQLMKRIKDSATEFLENYPSYYFYKYIQKQFGSEYKQLLEEIGSSEMNEVYQKSTDYIEMLLKLKEKELEVKKE